MNELKSWENLIDAFRLYKEDVYTFIYFRCNKSKELAEDFTQDTFEKAWLKRAQFKGGDLRNWLFQIALNISRDEYRKATKVDVLEEETVNLESMSETEIYKYWIQKALSKLNTKERELIILYFILGITYEELASIYSKREGAIRTSVSRAFLKLKKIANERIK